MSVQGATFCSRRKRASTHVKVASLFETVLQVSRSSRIRGVRSGPTTLKTPGVLRSTSVTTKSPGRARR
jgi:hypothetical protein